MSPNEYIQNLIKNANNSLKEENEYTKNGKLIKEYYSIKGLNESMYDFNMTDVLEETTTRLIFDNMLKDSTKGKIYENMIKELKKDNEKKTIAYKIEKGLSIFEIISADNLINGFNGGKKHNGLKNNKFHYEYHITSNTREISEIEEDVKKQIEYHHKKFTKNDFSQSKLSSIFNILSYAYVKLISLDKKFEYVAESLLRPMSSKLGINFSRDTLYSFDFEKPLRKLDKLKKDSNDIDILKGEYGIIDELSEVMMKRYMFGRIFVSDPNILKKYFDEADKVLYGESVIRKLPLIRKNYFRNDIPKENTMTDEQEKELKELYKKSSEETYEEFDDIIKGNDFNFDNS